MNFVLELMEGLADAFLTTPFAMTLTGLLLIAAVLVVGFAVKSGQELGQ